MGLVLRCKCLRSIFPQLRKPLGCDYFGKPFEAISEDKQRLLTDAAEAYIDSFDYNCEARFDVISIILKKGEEPIIEHFEWAFIP